MGEQTKAMAVDVQKLLGTVDELRDRYSEEEKSYREAQRHWEHYRSRLRQAEQELREVMTGYLGPEPDVRNAKMP